MEPSEIAIPKPPVRDYVVYGFDEKYHEVSFLELREWAKSGRVTSGHQVYSLLDQQWLTAEDVAGLRSVFFSRKPEGKDVNVSVSDVSMPLGSMIVFMIKWAVASIPAAIIIGFPLLLLYAFVML